MSGMPALFKAPADFRPVPPELVHKLDRDEVLLTGWRETARDAFEATARWPRNHGFYQSAMGTCDPLMIAETIRQLLPLLSHSAYNVPLGHHLIWEDFHYSLDSAALSCEGVAVDLHLSVRTTEISWRGNRAAAMTLHTKIHRGMQRVGEARTRFTINSPAVYKRLRGRYADIHQAMAGAVRPVVPLDSGRVGRTSLYDVVLCPGPGPATWQLCVDTSHPVLFDHPLDHVPGMLLLEAVRQAAVATVYPHRVIPVSVSTEFHRYVEFDAPCWVSAQVLPPQTPQQARLQISLHQGEALACRAVIGVEWVASPFFPSSYEPAPSGTGGRPRFALATDLPPNLP